MINYIRNLRIRLKLYILIGVALLGMLIISGMSFFLMGRMNDMTNDISASWLPSVDIARDLSTTISNIRLNELGYLTAISDDVDAPPRVSCFAAGEVTRPAGPRTPKCRSRCCSA